MIMKDSGVDVEDNNKENDLAKSKSEKDIKNKIRYDFQQDNHFTELKDSEILRERLQSLDSIQNYVGEYYSKEWVRKNILRMSDEDIEEMKEQIAQEKEDEPEDEMGMEPNAPPAPQPVTIVEPPKPEAPKEEKPKKEPKKDQEL